jgi:hypothetical protein
LSSISVIVLTFGLYFSFFYIDLYYRHKSNFNKQFVWEILSDKRLFLSFLVLTCFHSHFLYSVFVVINNYLSYLYLFKIDNSINQLANKYISNFIAGNVHIYIWIMFLFVLIGVSISLIRVKQIRKGYFLNKNNLRNQ